MEAPHEAGVTYKMIPRDLALVLYLAALWVLILLPFNFHAPRRPWRNGPEPAAILEEEPPGLAARLIKSAAHAVLFLPLAPLLAWRAGGSTRRLYSWKTAALVISLALSSELFQLTVSRGASVPDLLMDFAGYAAGVIIVIGWRRSGPEGRLRLERAAPVFASIALAASIAGILLLLRPARGLLFGPRDLEVWDPTYPFLVGNELTRARPWLGSIQSCTVHSRAIDPARDDPGQRNLPVLAYDFGPSSLALGPGGRIEEARGSPGPPLRAWDGSGILAAPSGGIELAKPSLLWTARGSEGDIHTLRESGAFSVELRFVPRDLEQRGPARIVSSSISNRRRNFTLGQEGDGLELRVRTPLTGLNGSISTLLVPRCLSPGRPAHVIASYEGGRLKLHMDGELRGSRRLDLLGWLCWRFFGSSLDGRVAAGLGFVAWTSFFACIWIALSRSRLAAGRALSVAAAGAALLVLVLVFSSQASAEPGPDLEVVRRIDRGEPIFATPAAAAGRLYLRTWERLYAIGGDAD